jgi:hypothetical protein
MALKIIQNYNTHYFKWLGNDSKKYIKVMIGIRFAHQLSLYS